MKTKEFLNVMEKDLKKDNFSMVECVIYGVLAPLGLLAAMLLVGAIGSLVQ